MRLPTRKAERDRRLMATDDPFVTPVKLVQMKRELDDLVKNKRGPAAEEVHRTAQMGDLSENAAYQFAKANLRRINSRITTLEERLKHAQVIDTATDGSGVVKIGSTVKLKTGDREVTYQILGSLESNPARGRISYHSPLGSLLMGKSVGDIVALGNTSHTIIEVC